MGSGSTERGGLPTGARVLQAMIRQACDLVGVLTPDGSIDFAVGERALGYPEGELIGHLVLSLIHPDEVE
ncbi:MAG TPA: PAS domain-containing protein, partial [Acidimicrobiales bacterium]|nr:PAS domain-containing protein [Acidimicrobiales bacterium]